MLVLVVVLAWVSEPRFCGSRNTPTATIPANDGGLVHGVSNGHMQMVSAMPMVWGAHACPVLIVVPCGEASATDYGLRGHELHESVLLVGRARVLLLHLRLRGPIVVVRVIVNPCPPFVRWRWKEGAHADVGRKEVFGLLKKISDFELPFLRYIEHGRGFRPFVRMLIAVPISDVAFCHRTFV